MESLKLNYYLSLHKTLFAYFVYVFVFKCLDNFGKVDREKKYLPELLVCVIVVKG